MTQSIKVMVKKPGEPNDITLPFYATTQSAGMDLAASIEKSIILKPMERKLIPTGIAMALPEGFEAQVRPRSGLSIRHGITVINAPGTIDADYRGEIKVPLINLSNENFEITPGMRIAQMVVNKYYAVEWDIVESLEETSRNESGFGSTGV